jgi:hypothetical protein
MMENEENYKQKHKEKEIESSEYTYSEDCGQAKGFTSQGIFKSSLRRHVLIFQGPDYQVTASPIKS